MTPGTRIGPYEIVASVGAGGMGEVYRARDPRLLRDVAVKVLPAAFAADGERLARFSREAQVLAALNHPHIAQVYGIEESGGAPALVMEFVDGPTLADRIARGVVPLEEALPIARQLAEALEVAHERGIVHRDLKPANVKLTADGAVKVLDFGLAKAVERPASGRSGPSGTAAADAALTTPAVTEAGVVLGTAAYMSPEQARGRPVDKRADIWAFGAVLYEMLTGRRPFDGESVTDALAAVLTRDVDLAVLPASTPHSIRELIRRCLTRAPARRLHDIADARIVIEDAIAGVDSPAPAAAPVRTSAPARSLAPWLLSALLAVAAAVAIVAALRPPSPVTPLPMHVGVTLPAGVTLSLGRGSSVAVAPDGRRVAFVATANDRTQLYVRDLDRSAITPLAGTDGAANPFFSPDGQWLGFHADGQIRKVAMQGGSVASVTPAGNLRGQYWSPDDAILFTRNNASALTRVSSAGGAGSAATTLQQGEMSHRWPQVLADAKTVVFTIWNDTGFEGGRVAVEDLTTHERRVLVQGGGYGRVVPVDRSRGYLVFARAEGLAAAPIDLARMELTGGAVPVLDGVISNLSGGAHFDVATNGMLAYIPGRVDEAPKTLTWIDRTGRVTSGATIGEISVNYDISPDGKRLVRLNTNGPNRDVWIEDLERGGSTRVTAGGVHFTPRWTSDGSRIVYAAGLPNQNLYWKAADVSASEERLTTSDYPQFAGSVSPDGRMLAYVEFHPVSNADIWVLPLRDDAGQLLASDRRRPRPYRQTPFSEGAPVFSPDGRWIAFQANDGGRFEIYVAPSAGGTPTRVSTAGGTGPIWAPDGRELYYRATDQMLAVSLSSTPTLSPGTPQLLFRGTWLGDGDISPDGKRFLFLTDPSAAVQPSSVQLIVNWIEELKAKVPMPR
jgi:serine/threonine-protein kinase